MVWMGFIIVVSYQCHWCQFHWTPVSAHVDLFVLSTYPLSHCLHIFILLPQWKRVLVWVLVSPLMPCNKDTPITHIHVLTASMAWKSCHGWAGCLWPRTPHRVRWDYSPWKSCLEREAVCAGWLAQMVVSAKSLCLSSCRKNLCSMPCSLPLWAVCTCSQDCPWLSAGCVSPDTERARNQSVFYELALGGTHQQWLRE